MLARMTTTAARASTADRHWILWRILDGMTGGVTTIKVPRELRDRLARLARQRRVTMAEVLDGAVTRMEREAFFARMQSELARLRDSDPPEWESYRAEGRQWERASLADGLGREEQTT
jgi:predicted transcriptional regulator